MRKKFLLIAISFLVAIAFVACGETTVLDETDPVLSGYSNITYVIGESSTPNYAQGVTAYDNLDGNITSKIVINSAAVDLTEPGTYTVTYSVTDLSGNAATASITVTVVDLGAPSISGIHSFVFVFGDDDPDYLEGVTATDAVDGDLTAAIVVDSSEVDLEVAGVYTITYVVEDASGNSSAVYSTYIQVKEHADDADLVPPVFNGQTNKTYTIGISSAPNYLTGVTATDAIDGDLTAAIAVNSSAVNLTVPGVYTVTYTVEDESGNVATVSITVTVALETVPPVIGGIRILEYYVNEVPNYKLGLTVTDNVDTTISVDDIVVDSSAVNMQVAGRYAITFTVTDAAGNVGTAETEIIVAINPVNLVPDLTAVYRTYTSGTDNMNPYSETLATASELYGYLTDSLYSGDYDWGAALQILIDEGEAEVGDTIGFDEWYAAGHTAGELPYNRFPAMAASEPQMMDEDGLVWRIALRHDLQFVDGTPIDANTFDYSWRMLLDPLLLNDRASNLYANEYLPLENAEAYFKQNSYKSDSLGFDMYTLGDGKVTARENSYSVDASANTGYDLYEAQSGLYQNFYVEYWGTSYTTSGWVLVDFDDRPFYKNAAGQCLGYAGTTYVDANGTAIPARNAVIAGVDTVAKGYYEALPAYFTDNEDGTYSRTAVLANGLPDGTLTHNDPVAWSEVGFKVIDDYTIELTLATPKTAWDVKGNLESGIVGVVHPANFEAGMNAGRTQTTYGTIDNPLVSYGPYVLSVWQTGVLFMYTKNPTYYAKNDYRIGTIRYDVIIDQSIAVSEFKEGRLDVVGAGGAYYNEFKYNKNLKLTPATTFFRFAFNVEGSDAYDLNPILVYPEFRQAFYFAIDRATFCTDVRAPSLPTFGFLGPVYLSTEYGFVSYRGSAAGQSVLADLSPETNGFDPVRAKQLFDEAYAKAVEAGVIADGDVVSVEYKYYDVETNRQVANWVKSTVEAIFNGGETSPKFNLVLSGVSDTALDDAWDNGDFEMTFGGWQGLNFDAPSMLGQVYNSAQPYILEKGFNTADAEVTVSLPASKVALAGWIADFETKYAAYLADPETGTPAPTESAEGLYNAWVDLYALFVGDDLTCTFNELFNYAYGELYNVNDINYAGKTDDFDRITAALEGVLLDQMIAIPLFTTVGATVYSANIVFEANEYHAWMGWGGLKYMYIGKAAE